MAKRPKPNPERDGGEDDPTDLEGAPDDPSKVEIPDLRVVSLVVDVQDDDCGDVEVDLAGDVGHYEAIGMMVSALAQMVLMPLLDVIDFPNPRDSDE